MITAQSDKGSGEVSSVSQKIPVKTESVESAAEGLMESLGAKQRLILMSRLGIGNGGPKTLEAIGKNLNITRERVRQIEADALKSLQDAKKSFAVGEIIFIIEEFLSERGEISGISELAEGVFEKYSGGKLPTEKERQLLEVIFSAAGLKKMKANREMKDVWASPKFDAKRFRRAVLLSEKVFDETKRILSEEELLKKIDHLETESDGDRFSPEEILNFVGLSRKFGKNVFGYWGKAKWPLVKPRGVREKATLVLLNQKNPLHFREISQLIEKLKLSEKKVHPQTVHNELIRDKRFVLVGRGTYALREWGYEEGTVKDIIISVLKSAGGILTRERITSDVLKKRKVKKATIDVNLSDRKLFEKTEKGYRLK